MPAIRARVRDRMTACAAAAVAAGALAAAARRAQTAAPARSGGQSRPRRKLSEVEQQGRGAHDRDLGRLRGDLDARRSRSPTCATSEAVLQEELEQQAGGAARGADAPGGAPRPPHRAIELLEERLIAIYKSGEPDLLGVVLDSDGFDDLLERTEYLQRSRTRTPRSSAGSATFATRCRQTVITRQGSAGHDRRAQAGAGEHPGAARAAQRRAGRRARAPAGGAVGRSGPAEGAGGRPLRHLGPDREAARRRSAARRCRPARSAAARAGSSGRSTDRSPRASAAAGAACTRASTSACPRDADPRRQVGHDRSRLGLRRLRQLHLHQPRRRALHLLRPPVALRPHLGLDQPGLDPRLRRLHRPLLRRSPPLRGAHQRLGGRPAGLPLAVSARCR